VNWLLARSELTQDDKLVHKKEGVAAIQEKTLQLTEKKRLGLFKSDRENDVLNRALGNAEHTRRIRGVASQMPWKVGFPNDAWSYKKCDRYKRNLEDVIEEKINSIFETKFRSYMQSLIQERPLELQQITHNLSSPPHLSSISSTAAVPMWYPVDDIMGDTHCCLHIPIGRVGNKTKEVVIGVTIPGRVFHNNPIPAEYAKVLVHEITVMTCIDYPLDHVTPEGIKEFGEAINQFILRNQREIILDNPTMPQNQLILLLSQTMTSKDNEALLPTSSPPVPKFKEASLLSSPKEKEVSLSSSPKKKEDSTLSSSPVKVMP
jgi:hypothetical protein